MAEQFEILFGIKTVGVLSNSVLDSGPDFPVAMGGSGGKLCFATTTEWIMILFLLQTLEDPSHVALDRGPSPPWQGDAAFT